MKNSIQLIENILDQHRNSLGNDFEKYKNHVHRIFALCLELEGSEKNSEKYAIAAVFHDLGIWTDKTFDYLKPSISLATIYLKNSGKADWTNEIKVIIDMHHKRSKYKGEYENTVEIFRKADWIDVTMGRKKFGLERSVYNNIKDQYPTLGFHKFLVTQTIKNFLKSPLNPLPMFKK